MSIRTRFTYLFLSFALIGTPAAAQTSTITDGAPSTEWDGSLTGFRLVAPNTQLNGEVMQSVSHVFTAGTRADLNGVINTSNQSHHPFTEEVNGTMYNVWPKGQFTFTTQPMAIPSAPDGTRATFSTPFTATGTFCGYADEALTQQVFCVSIQGSGVASAVAMMSNGGTWSFIGGGGEIYQFTGPLPSLWTATDVGAVGIKGISSWNNNVYYVAGAGADIWGAADAFQFVSQPLPGDGSIVAHVNAPQQTSTYAKAGIMIRQNTSASAADVILDVRPGGYIEFMTRGAADGNTTYIAGSVLAQPWLKLTRTGNIVNAAISSDGSSWTTLGTAQLAGSALVGLAVTSHDRTVLSQASFDHVAIAASGGGSFLPPGWSHADVGAVGIAGDANISGATFTVSGAGADIWGRADAFHYAYTAMNSDGFVQARVVSESNTDAFAKAGVMFRDSVDDPGSTHVILDFKPDGFVEFMTRAAAGDSTTYITGVQKSFPVSLKIQRIYATTNSIFIAFVFDTSSRTWQQIGWVQIPMGPNATAGLAVNSHNTGMLNTATFDTVAVEKNLLVQGSFEGYTPPALGPPGWVSDQPLRAVAAGTDTHPHNGYQNGACIQTTYQDCGLYQEFTSPDTATYTLSFFANADRGGVLVGVNVDGQNQGSVDVPVRVQGNYGAVPLTLQFSARAGAIVRVWLYSPPSPGFADIDDVSVTEDFTD